MKNINTATFIKEIFVTDPDTLGEVNVSLFKHNQSGGIFGIDSSFLEQLSDDDQNAVIQDPFNKGAEVILQNI